MQAADEDKVLLTLNLLQGTAYHWWLTQPASQQDPPEITWEELLRAFRELFLPPSIMRIKCKISSPSNRSGEVRIGNRWLTTQLGLNSCYLMEDPSIGTR
ncbi:hypothetical protein LINPERHAP2_LOCUS19824 [Linum perenne]